MREFKKCDIKKMPAESRPRERLLALGPKELATYELLAILLRTGTRHVGPIEIALSLIEEFGDLYRLKQASYGELIKITGIGPIRALELLAAFELGDRLSAAKRPLSACISSSECAASHFLRALGHLNQEHVMVLYLTSKNQLIKKSTLFKGGLTASIAHPREIYREALRYSAARIIVGHNHPSGNPEPSEADIKLTKRLIKAGRLMGVECLDHIIVGQDRYLSLHQYGAFAV